mmetsp:Transcript_27916/g.33066  ORF Transcript_27916/g.33066 Transcript_27916/m.33066 type:complete len:80 (+) Transcript_27916:1567-1806(+)
MDPPWGGLDYKSTDKLPLDLGGIDLGDLTERLKGSAKYVTLKVPENFAVDDFKQRVSPGKVTVDKSYRKMLLLIVDFQK